MPRKQDTHNLIRMAIVRMENGKPKVVSTDRKISVKAVAEEAGVSDSLIHKDYPDLIQRIKKTQGKNDRKAKNAKNVELKLERGKNRHLRDRIKDLENEIKDLASINASLELELSTYRAIAKNDNVSKFSEKR